LQRGAQLFGFGISYLLGVETGKDEQSGNVHSRDLLGLAPARVP
jgi:hypothetical protein